MEMIIDLQTAEARKRIRRALVESAKAFRTDRHIEIPMPAVLASAEKVVSTA